MAGTPTFYILYGDDSISLRESLKRLRAAMGEDGELNTSEFEGESTSVPEALAAVKSLPFLAEKRLVIVRGLISRITRRGAGQSGKREVERLIAELPQLPDFARLVLIESETLADNNAVLVASSKLENGFIRRFEAPKNLSGWIVRRAKAEYGTEITARAANAIAAVVNDDLLLADNELFKLACYAEDGQAISEDDVAALTPYVPEASIFEMVDALASGDGQRALELMHRSLGENPGDPGFRLYGMIVRQFRMLLMAKDHLDRGGGSQASTIAQALKVHPFVAGKLNAQARAFTLEQLTG